jgi:hypothetical protein
MLAPLELHTLVLLENLACPARFERATYALEEFVAAEICNYFNELQLRKDNVVY